MSELYCAKFAVSSYLRVGAATVIGKRGKSCPLFDEIFFSPEVS